MCLDPLVHTKSQSAMCSTLQSTVRSVSPKKCVNTHLHKHAQHATPPPPQHTLSVWHVCHFLNSRKRITGKKHAFHERPSFCKSVGGVLELMLEDTRVNAERCGPEWYESLNFTHSFMRIPMVAFPFLPLEPNNNSIRSNMQSEAADPAINNTRFHFIVSYHYAAFIKLS